ncbi:glutathione S-transferase [Rhodobacterales bacterium HKCCE3408]|nr:glutathione S-transferase [Rhodobacterales bacterium HKCCE3408]
MLKVIGGLRTRTFRVLWMLEELGLSYTHEPVQPRTPEVLAADPGGKVPVLVTDDGTLWDSTAILTWLTDRHGRFSHTAGTIERARQDAMTGQILDEIEGPLWMSSRHSFILPEEHRMPAIKDSLRWEFARNLDRLAARLGDAEYLAGDTPTIPDFLLAHCVNWAAAAKFEVGEPRIVALADRMRARPAYERVVALARA